MQQKSNKLGYLGFLGLLGFLGYLGWFLNKPNLRWLHLLHLFFLFSVFFLPTRKKPSLHSLQSGQASTGLQQPSNSIVRITEPSDLSIPIYLNQQIVYSDPQKLDHMLSESRVQILEHVEDNNECKTPTT